VSGTQAGDCSGGACTPPPRKSSSDKARGATALVELSTQGRAPLVALAGNPNTGKSTIFNRLTGHRAKVANYPGVTVERLEGRTLLPGIARSVRVLDVPGAYSLAARSGEEWIALASIAGLDGNERPDVVVLVVDATQLARNLYLATSVIEFDVPVIVAVNLLDELEAAGARFDAAALARALGVPVVGVCAQDGRGFEDLKARIAALLEEPAAGRRAELPWRKEPALAEVVARIGALVPEAWHGGSQRRRAAFARFALLSLEEGDEIASAPAALRAAVVTERAAAEARGLDLDERLVHESFTWIDDHASSAVVRSGAAPRSFTERIDALLLHPLLGFVSFLALMTVVFQTLFAWSDPLIGAVEEVFAGLGGFLAAHLPAGFLTDLLVEGVVAGVGGVLVFLPQILLLFLFAAVMEGTGYMARVAFLMDRIMRSVGLHGRAFVPMMSGLACAIPAVMATRTMERRRDRLLTMMVVPLMTCSARLPVFALMIAAIVPVDDSAPFAAGLLMAAMYLFSTIVALVAAAVIGRTVLAGPNVPLLLELPPYRWPRPLGVLRAMFERGFVFVREAGTVILACTIGMWLLLTFPKGADVPVELTNELVAVEAQLAAAPDDEVLAVRESELSAAVAGHELRHSFAGTVGHAIEPTIAPLGFDWQIGIGLIGAFAAREVFVSTMAIVYGVDESANDGATLRENLREQRRADGSRLYTPLVCLSLMVFFALACQCMSTLAVVKRETAGWRWPLFMFAYMTALAWLASFVVYQGGRAIGFE
jgi:ferrous iron transport protein B